MPEVGAGYRVPCPIRPLSVEKDDPCFGVLLIGLGPDVIIPGRRSRLRPARTLEPRVLIGRVVDHQLGDHPDAARMCGSNEALEVTHCAVLEMDRAVIADVV